ncbi:PBP1A family penicillin-binding protein [Candidatus Saccharibacteria bacterium]|nr:MAG: PBP1A family penicillin-binding protein [Candidatus Saccharibacteria bacterium]
MKKHQPARMNRYSNLASKSKPHSSSRRHRTRQPRMIAWFVELSLKRKVLVLAMPILLFLIVTPVITYLLLANDIRDQERLMNRNNTGLVLLDKDGKSFYSIGKAEHRTLVQLDQMAPDAKNALIATEDKDFYKHAGFNLGSIIRSLWTNLVLRRAAYGGSTITQQLVKNTLLTDDKNVLRKYQELVMAIAIEQNYTKDQILMMYLNSVYYGENAFGIEEAAKTYYGKTPKDLTLAESAMLIGILPAPSAYSPISGNADYAKQRQEKVLTRMVAEKYITEDQKAAALAEQLTYAKSADTPDSIAPHFVEMVIGELSEKYGYEQVMRSGFQVTTTLDTNAQGILNQSVAGQLGYVNRNGGSNISAVIIDPKSGEIRSLVGSADYNNDKWGKVNMVTTARQPGSSFKPIYYSQALADGVITPATIYHDELTDFGGGYKPMNASRQWYGDVTVRKALNWSLNIPSIKVMQDYTIDKSVAGAKKLGIQLDQNRDHNLTLALGSEEVPLLTMTNAYAAFANQGQQYKTAVIKKVDDKFGKRILMNSQTRNQAINKEGAYLISNILSDNQARSGIFGSSLNIPGHTAAVKTGTTNDSRDAWTIGYTPDYVIGVWVGNNDNSPMNNGGSGMAGPVWRNTLIKLLVGVPDKKFDMPSGIVQRNICTANGGLASKTGSGTYSEYFMAGALPTKSCTPDPVIITVCNLDTKKTESIDEETFDSVRYSKNLDDCKPVTIAVCDLATGQIKIIEEIDYDTDLQSKDTGDCVAHVKACDTTNGTVVWVRTAEFVLPRYTNDIENCVASP